ncbi:MAG: putative quinol monooxygenase [Thermoanaerobaculia bacterium]
MKNWVAWMLEMQVVDGRERDVRALMDEMVSATQANEPGTLNYEWSFSADGKTCHLYERYVDSDAAMIHAGTFDARFAGRFLEVLKPTRFVFYGSPSQDVMDAAATFNPSVMIPAAAVTR